jgi:ABC-type lipoprotein release transport system permease subunit
MLSKAASVLFFNVHSADFLSFALAPLVLAGIALIAGFIPARRAADLDPLAALRQE